MFMCMLQSGRVWDSAALVGQGIRGSGQHQHVPCANRTAYANMCVVCVFTLSSIPHHLVVVSTDKRTDVDKAVIVRLFWGRVHNNTHTPPTSLKQPAAHQHEHSLLTHLTLCHTYPPPPHTSLFVFECKNQQQALVVQGFRDSTINVLIATSVGSEGMDFRQCQLVVAFDLPKVCV